MTKKIRYRLSIQRVKCYAVLLVSPYGISIHRVKCCAVLLVSPYGISIHRVNCCAVLLVSPYGISIHRVKWHVIYNTITTSLINRRLSKVTVAKVRLCRKPEYEKNKTVLVTEYGFHIYLSYVSITFLSHMCLTSYTQHAGRKTWRSSSEVSVSASAFSKLDNVNKF
jgi:hypothetical protein